MQCKSCENPAHRGSNYCLEHKKIARANWVKMIGEKSQERQKRQTKFASIWSEAVAAGNSAGQAHAPKPMVVVENSNPIDERSDIKESWVVPDGVCGFAWVIVRPGTCSFARWLVKSGYGKKSYYGGIMVWVNEYNQSAERKIAHASAMAKVFCKYGIGAYSNSRLD